MGSSGYINRYRAIVLGPTADFLVESHPIHDQVFQMSQQVFSKQLMKTAYKLIPAPVYNRYSLAIASGRSLTACRENDYSDAAAAKA